MTHAHTTLAFDINDMNPLDLDETPHPHRPHLVALIGDKNSGKTTLARALCKAQDLRFTRYALATPIKTMLVPLFRALGMTDEEAELAIYGADSEKSLPRQALNNLTSRQFQQTLGEWGRSQWHSLWITAATRTILEDVSYWQNYAGKGTNIVIEDVRHLNEISALRELALTLDMNFTIVKVQRHGNTNYDPHVSEQEHNFIRHDFLIHNPILVGDSVIPPGADTWLLQRFLAAWETHYGEPLCG